MKEVILKALIDCRNRQISDVSQIATRIEEFLDIANTLSGMVAARPPAPPPPPPQVQQNPFAVVAPSESDVVMAERSRIDTAVQRGATPNFDAPIAKAGEEREFWASANDLMDYLKGLFPPSLTIRAIGMTEDLTLLRAMRMLVGTSETMGGSSVQVTYAPPGMTTGVQTVFNTFQKAMTNEQIAVEIDQLKQAAAKLYGKKKIEVQTPPTQGYSTDTAMWGGDVEQSVR